MTLETIKNSWTYNHKHVIVTLSLIVVIIVQAFGSSVRDYFTAYKPAPVVYAQTQVNTLGDDYTDELERKAIEQYNRDFNENMQKAMTKVLIAEQVKLQEAAQILPRQDFEYLKQVINSMNNTN